MVHTGWGGVGRAVLQSLCGASPPCAWLTQRASADLCSTLRLLHCAEKDVTVHTHFKVIPEDTCSGTREKPSGPTAE